MGRPAGGGHRSTSRRRASRLRIASWPNHIVHRGRPSGRLGRPCERGNNRTVIPTSALPEARRGSLVAATGSRGWGGRCTQMGSADPPKRLHAFQIWSQLSRRAIDLLGPTALTASQFVSARLHTRSESGKRK
eukprot:6794977-Prymnesium_polylepis.2